MKTIIKNILTIPKNIIDERDYVVIPRSYFEEMKRSMIPTFYLKGNAAKKLDNRVKMGTKEHNVGKTIKSKSLKEAFELI